MKKLMGIGLLVFSAMGSTLADDWVTNNATLNLLRLQFTNRVYIVETTRVETAFVWVSRPYAATCQRPLNLYLVSNQVGGFVNPKGWTFTNSTEPYAKLIVQIQKDVQVYLATNRIGEAKVAVGSSLYGEYILKDTQNQALMRLRNPRRARLPHRINANAGFARNPNESLTEPQRSRRTLFMIINSVASVSL